MYKRKPDYVNPKATYHFEDIRKENVLAKHLRDADVVVHLAAMVVAGREALGASKNELIADFRPVPPGDLMEEIDNLVRLDALTLDDPGSPKTFVKSAELLGTVRYRATPRGKQIAESPKGDELTIDEIV